MEGKLDKFTNFILYCANKYDAVEFSKSLGVKENNIFLFEQLKIDNVRDIRQRSTVFHSEKMAFVFGDVGFDAQNALLKLTEEPPDNTLFVFYKPENLLDTIKSRCQFVSFGAKKDVSDSMKKALDTLDAVLLFKEVKKMENLPKSDMLKELKSIMFYLLEIGYYDKAERLKIFIEDLHEFNLNKKLVAINVFSQIVG